MGKGARGIIHPALTLRALLRRGECLKVLDEQVCGLAWGAVADWFVVEFYYRDDVFSSNGDEKLVGRGGLLRG